MGDNRDQSLDSRYWSIHLSRRHRRQATHRALNLQLRDSAPPGSGQSHGIAQEILSKYPLDENLQAQTGFELATD